MSLPPSDLQLAVWVSINIFPWKSAHISILVFIVFSLSWMVYTLCITIRTPLHSCESCLPPAQAKNLKSPVTVARERERKDYLIIKPYPWFTTTPFPYGWSKQYHPVLEPQPLEECPGAQQDELSVCQPTVRVLHLPTHPKHLPGKKTCITANANNRDSGWGSGLGIIMV